MNRTLRGLIYGVGGLLLVLLLLVIAIPFVVHPNQYRAPIAALVKNLTGRELIIHGDVGFSLLPDLEVILQDVTLANDPEFGTNPMARVTTVAVGVQFLPLLSGRLEVDRASMLGLSLYLQRNGAGKSNWDDFSTHLKTNARQSEPQPVVNQPVDLESSTSKKGPVLSEAKPVAVAKPVVANVGGMNLSALSIGGVDIIGAKLYWQDDVSGRHYTVENLNLKTGPMQVGRPVPVTMGFLFSEATHKMQGRVDAKYQLRLAAGMVWLDGLEIGSQVTAIGQSVKEAKLRFVADLAMNLNQGTAVFSKTQLSAHLWSGVEWLRDVVFEFHGKAEVDLAHKRLLAPQSLFTALFKANTLPPAGVQLRIGSNLIVNLDDQTLHMEQLAIEGPANIRAIGALKTHDLLTKPITTGHIAVSRFDFKTLLIALGQTIPANRDAKICSGAEAEFDFLAHSQEVKLSNLSVGFDDSHLNGHLSWQPKGPVLLFDATVDTLVLDHYLPVLVGNQPEVKVSALGEPEAAKSAHSEEVVPPVVKGEVVTPQVVAKLPLSWLTPELSIDGQLKIGKLTAAKGHFTDLRGVMRVKQGYLQIKPLSMALYGGHLDAVAALDVQPGKPPIMRLQPTFTGVQVGSILQEMAAIKGVSGQGDVMLNLEATGDDVAVMTKNLQGTLKLAVNNGEIPGLDAVKTIRKAYSVFKRVRLPEQDTDSTAFSALTATAVINNGVLDNQDLLLISPILKMSGAGQVDFVNRHVDYLFKADVESALNGVVADAQKYQGLVLPMRLRSSFDSMKKLDVGSLNFSQLATEALRQRVIEKVGDKVGEADKAKINHALEQIEKKVAPSVNRFLKNFMRQ